MSVELWSFHSVHSRVAQKSTKPTTTTMTSSALIFILRPKLPMKVLSWFSSPPPLGYEPRPSFSLSEYVRLRPLWLLGLTPPSMVGRLSLIFLTCLAKKPWPRVEKPLLTASLLALAVAHETPPLDSAYGFLGDMRPSREPSLRPGLAQPPPRKGEGERDRDMGELVALFSRDGERSLMLGRGRWELWELYA